MKKPLVLLLSPLLVGFLQFGTADAALIVHEGFDGASIGLTPISGTTTNPGLTYGSLNTSGNAWILSGGNSGGGGLNASVSDTTAYNGTYSTTGTVWMSWLVTTNDGAQGGDGQYWQRLVTSNVGSESYNLGLMNNGGANKDWGIRGVMSGQGSSFSNNYASQATIPLNTTFMLAAAYNFGASGSGTGSLTLYVNPTGLGTGAAPSSADFTQNVTGVSDSLLAFDQVAFNGNFSFDNKFDELRIGETWADVSPVPEPSTLIALIGGMFLLVARRRRRA